MKPGRPKGPDKVLFRARVLPETAKILHGIVYDGAPYNVAEKVVPEPPAPIQPSGDIKALLEDIESLTRKVAGLEEKIQRVARLTDNEKLLLWIKKYDTLVAKVKAKYPDESF